MSDLASNYSRISTNGHLSTKVIFLADNPYIDSCLNVSTTATFVCPQTGCCDLLWRRSTTRHSMRSGIVKIIEIIATNGSSVTLTLVVLKGRVGNNFFISPSLTLFTKPFHCVLQPSIVHLKTSGIRLANQP